MIYFYIKIVKNKYKYIMSKEQEKDNKILRLEKELDRLKKNLKKQKYGLVWMDVPEAFEDDVENKLPILKENPKLAIKNNDGKPTHILIEGDNYHALTCLNYTHKGKVDVIYIDPPYNTGSDGFRYKDKRILDKFPDGTEVPKDHPYRHSYWLSFMRKRVELSRDILKEDGIIFISIGEDELAQLRFLCDEIFGGSNYISTISRVAKTASNKGSYFAPSVDFILCYAKNILMIDSFIDEVDIKLYKKEDEKGFYRDDVALYQSSLDPMRGCTNQRYYIECPDGSLVLPPGKVEPKLKKDAQHIKPETAEDKVWRWSYKTYLEKKELLVFKNTKTSPLLDEKGLKAKWNIYTKSYLNERNKTGTVPRNYVDKFINRKGADLLKRMGIDFNYSKPVELIKWLIKIVNKDNCLVLDYFAGSGTTGQAVMELNDENGSHHQFILVTNNEEVVNGTTHKIMTDICYPRISKVIKGYNDVKSLGNSIRYYYTDFVGENNILDATDKDKIELAHNAGELLAIAENTFELVKQDKYMQIFENDNQYTAVYFKEEMNKLDDFVAEVKKLKKDVSVYIFSWEDEAMFDDFEGLSNIRLKTIPQPIVEIYKQIYNLI